MDSTYFIGSIPLREALVNKTPKPSTPWCFVLFTSCFWVLDVAYNKDKEDIEVVEYKVGRIDSREARRSSVST